MPIRGTEIRRAVGLHLFAQTSLVTREARWQRPPRRALLLWKPRKKEMDAGTKTRNRMKLIDFAVVFFKRVDICYLSFCQQTQQQQASLMSAARYLFLRCGAAMIPSIATNTCSTLSLECCKAFTLATRRAAHTSTRAKRRLALKGRAANPPAGCTVTVGFERYADSHCSSALLVFPVGAFPHCIIIFFL